MTTETGGVIRFQYRWGETGQWKLSEVSPGAWQFLSASSLSGEEDPTLYLRYDDDPTSGVNPVSHPIRTVQSDVSSCQLPVAAHLFVLDDDEISVSYAPMLGASAPPQQRTPEGRRDEMDARVDLSDGVDLRGDVGVSTKCASGGRPCRDVESRAESETSSHLGTPATVSVRTERSDESKL